MLYWTSCRTFVRQGLEFQLAELQGKTNYVHVVNSKEGGSIIRPPILDGANYDHWKARMVAFLKSMDQKPWKAIIKGWEHHVVIDKEGKYTSTLKQEEEWSKEEYKLALCNSNASTALFNGIDKNMFILINT